MKAIYSALLFFFPILLFAQDFAQIVTSRDFEQDGSELVIYYEIPYGEDSFNYNFHSAYIFDKNYTKYNLQSVNGDRRDLKSGATYQLRWDVLKDVDEFYAPRKVEINLELTPDSELLAREKALADQKKKQLEAKAAEALRKKQERKKKKPFSVGFVGYGGYVHGLLGEADEDVNPETGYGLGLGLFLEKRVGDGWYLQIEGSYQQRNFFFSNTGSNSEYGFYACEIFYDIKKANVDFRDMRLYARLKFKNFFYVGGYYAWFRKAERRGERRFEAICPDFSPPLDHQIADDGDFRYSFLDKQEFAPDEFGNRPIQNDYGISIGVETPSFKNFVFSLGYDLSLGNILNDNYWRNTPDGDNLDFYPTEDVRLRLGYLYARFGVRI